MTPEQQALLAEHAALADKARRAAVPPETVSSPLGGGSPGAGVSTPPAVPPDAQALLDEYQVLQRKAALGRGEASAVLPAMGAQAAEAATIGAGFMAGAVSGAKAGAGLGTLTGPFAPYATPVLGAGGFLVGGVAGAVAGDTAFRPAKDILIERGYMYPSIGDAPGEVRPYLYGAQSLGGSVAGIGAMNFLAQSSLRMAPSTVGRFVNGYLDALKARPGVQNIRETLAATGAAAAITGAATQTEDPWVLLGAELTGGVLGGASPSVRILDFVVRHGNRVGQRFLAGSQETEAGRVLADMFRRYGEDPVQAAAAIESYLDTGTELPPALWMDSPAYRAATNLLMTQDSEAASRIKDATGKWFEVQARLIGHLRQTGDPKDLQTAARLEQDMMDAVMTATLNDAREALIESAAQFPKLTSLDRRQLSIDLTDRLLEVNDKFRAEEARLWGAIDRDLDAPIDVFVQGMDALKGRYTPELTSLASPTIKQFLARIRGDAPEATDDLLAGIPEADDPAVREFLGGLMEGGGKAAPPKLWQLQQMRSLVLSFQRAASAGEAANPTLAAYYGDVSDILLAQIEAALPEGMVAAYDAARNFTKAYHDVFTRSFVGEINVAKRSGADRLAPELMIRRATASGPEATALRFQQMQEAIQYLPGRGLDDPENALAITDMQNRIVRSFAADTLDAAGRISRADAEEFLSKHAILLEDFPEIRDEFQAALKSEEALKRLEDGFAEVDAIRKELPGLNRALDVDNATTAVDGALGHPTKPITQFRALALAAKNASDLAGNPRASRALLAATMDWAAGANGTADLGTQLRALTSPVGRFSGRAPGGGDAGPSPVDILRETGVITAEEAGRVQLMAETVARVTERMADRRIAAGVEAPDSILDTLLVNQLRVAGAIIGNRASITRGAGESIQAARMGSDLFAKVFNRMPQAKVRQLILQAIEDPELMVRLLKKAETPSEQLAATKAAMAYILPTVGTSISGDDGIQLDFGSEEE